MKLKNRLFYDAEFTELSRNGRLISIAFVADDESVFYAEFNDFSEEGLSDWIRTHVLSRLMFTGKSTHLERKKGSLYIKDTSKNIAAEFRSWIDRFGEIEIYADCPSFDWVFFCDLFGTAFDIPKSIFYIPFDVATLLKCKNIDPDISREAFVAKHMGKETIETFKKAATGQHNAIYDALITKAITTLLEKKTDE